ncbi:ROK family protein [Trichomonas vaginalis G3]|uniref:fructokinase n=1 Tax=Trichomonas vaginalis (strain ATCC PRA-98 / G3) TaxID=412133 RepID=A2FXV9_TRIV3|nr:ROK family [Trichomonas vaginalis G3]EAX90263.1 ROK family protein [Trichomonas vaginalis G3]KAI5499865.1 ROK family [Trichomonas vaginalis G3]|eukprot:XP_001303193.1 ROK family protein [Trichomonas vaginalis G3]
MLASLSRNFGKKYACGIELGGQTAAFAICENLGSFLYKKKGIKTREPTTPDEAVEAIVEGIKSSGYEVDRIGIASFGPLDVYKGSIGNTPKPKWGNYPLVASIQKEFPEAQVVLETDVNAPAYSEYLHLNSKDNTVKSVAYATIGTGVGVGVFCDGKPLHGKMHPEGGHFKPFHLPNDNFKGCCPFHGDCVEGMISAVALSKRTGLSLQQLPQIATDDPVWDCFTEYAAQLSANCALLYSLDYMVIGGGIVTAKGREYLIEKIQKRTKELLNGYIHVPKVIKPFYGGDAGLVGATAVALHPDVFTNN